MTTNNQKLLLREKDYELQAIKRIKQFQISFQDPLLNPPKPKKKRKAPIGFQKQTSPDKDPLAKLTRAATKMPQQASSLRAGPQKMVNRNEDENKLKQTPWEAILQNFLKVYDYRLQQYEPTLANVFGSQGKKLQEELRERMNRNSVAHRQSMIPSQLFGKKEPPKPEQTKQTIKLSISTYLKIVNEMKDQLKIKWAHQDKVSSLQVTIQSCKLLHDTTNAKFHAVKFAYVMQIVEQFGINVFERIKKLSFPNLSDQRIQELSIKDLGEANIPETAQQICRNWINKISSIRQLIPRVFVQTTLLRLYFFIDNGENAKKVLYRLAKSNRCFGQYINCIFFCTFLIRIGKEVLPQEKDYILDILDDVFFYIKQGRTKFGREDISYDEFFTILEPFFISSFESLSESLEKDKFKRFCKILPQNPHPIILRNFILSFSPSLLTSYSVDIVKILQKVYKDHKFPIYRLLLDRLSQMIFPQSGQFIIMVWTDLSQISDLQILLDLLGPFSEIIFRNLPRYEKNKFYSLILETFNNIFYNFRSTQKKIFDSFQKFLVGIVQKTEQISEIMTLQPFLQIICYFPTKNKRQISYEICKTFLQRGQKITDPVIVHIVLSLMKNMQGMAIKDLALQFLASVDFKTDFDQSLNFYAEMRAILGYIPEVTTALIYRAVNLTFEARRNSKGRMTKKLLSFLQATVAYCFITVPVIEDPTLKLRLYLFLSQIALANNLISQSTSLIKTCITQLSEVELQSDLQVFQIFHRIISFLIVMPDDPESDYLFLFNGLYQAFSIARLKSNLEHIIRFEFYTQCTVYISCLAQQKLPFHIQGVVSNDALFKSKEFRIALVERIHLIFQDLQKAIKQISKVDGIETDGYILSKLISCALTLTSVFETTPRLASLMMEMQKIIQKLKDKLFRDERNQKKYGAGISGLKKRLLQCEMRCYLN